MKESDISREIQIGLSEIGARVFRNNVGLFLTVDGRYVKTGLCNGSSDNIGWAKIKVTQEMVGKYVAVFLAVEVKVVGGEKKTSKKRLEDQRNFIEQVNNAGGIGFIATSKEEAVEKLRSFK